MHVVTCVAVEPYDVTRVRVAVGSETSVPLVPLLDPESLVFAVDAESLILADVDQGCGIDFASYSDPALRTEDGLLGFV